MTEVRSTNNQNLGLFATKTFQPGDIILEEDALFTFSASSKEQKETIRSQFKTYATKISSSKSAKKSSKKSVSFDDTKLQRKYDDDKDDDDDNTTANSTKHFLSDLISIPSEIDSEKYANKFLGMITAAVTYANANNTSTSNDTALTVESKTKLLELYAPSSSLSENKGHETNKYEKGVVELATKAISLLKENMIESSSLYAFIKDNEQECIQVMLIWACNAFQGGHVYNITSRINHSCDFNAVICTTSSTGGETDDTRQIVKAACEIKPKDEINISYLGSYTYADLYQRRHILQTDKFFDCHCTRCVCEESFGESTGSSDSCSNAIIGDVASSIPCTSSHPRFSGRYLEEDVQYDDDDDNVVHYAVRNYSVKSVKADEKMYVSKIGGVSKCVSLTPVYSATIDKTVDRVINHLDAMERNAGPNTSTSYDNHGEMAEMTERLLSLSYSVLGSKHYCTNLLLLQNLGKTLSGLNSTMMCNSMQTDKKRKRGKNGDSTSATEVDLTEVAESIDMLERCYKFINGLKLKSHPGHLLGNVTIGISRVLIGLGDVTSMKFGAEWAEKVEDYFACGFDDCGMIKVVTTLKNAWKRKSDEIDGYENQNKNINKRIKL